MSATAVIVRGVKARLRANGMSYRELADRIGVSEPTIKRDLSRGKFSLERLDKICEVLGAGIQIGGAHRDVVENGARTGTAS